MHQYKTILSIDGGGVRGVIPAMLLETIECKTGKPIHELFDLIAGTSTGGLLATYLAGPARCQGTGAEGCQRSSLSDFYQKYKNRIFRPRCPVLHRSAALTIGAIPVALILL